MFRMVPGNVQALIIHFITKTNFNAHGGRMFGIKKQKQNLVTGKEGEIKHGWKKRTNAPQSSLSTRFFLCSSARVPAEATTPG